MENLSNQLTRTCSACGIEKPLSAFLQLNSTHGTSYGKVCAKCRSKDKTEKSVSATDEERSTEPSGIGIRGKEKLYRDAKREQTIHTLKELYKKEDAKKQDTIDEKTKRTDLKETAEKKHREFYIDSKKQIDVPNKKTEASQQMTARQQTQKLLNTHRATENHKSILETTKQQHSEILKTIAKEETKKTTTDFNNLFHAIEPGKIEMQGELKRFFTWLGKSAPIVQTLLKGAKAPHQLSQELTTENKKNSSGPSRNKGS